MAYDPNVQRRAVERLEEGSRRRRERTERLRIDAYARQPRLEQLDRRIQGTMAGLVAATLRQGGEAVQAVRAVREENQSLQRERAALLAALGLPEDALDDRPACPLCGDRGWQGARMCHCLKRLCTEEQIKELSRLLDLGEQSFDAFRLDYYSEVVDPDMGTSPRDNMELIYDVCLNYAAKFDRFGIRNLFLTGAPGLGKTFLSACIARTVSENGFSVVYDTEGSVFKQFEAAKFRRNDSDESGTRDETRRYLHCDLLILDDLGSSMPTQFTHSVLYELINARLAADRRTVISSNLTMGDLAAQYPPRIVSRLAGEYHVLHFFGDDIRLLRKSQL